jgi:hypothetical protein
MRCASSCALAWLGGTTRLMAPQAQIGFHAASDGETGKVTSAGNALVGAYLNKIGLPYSAVVYITSAAPEAIAWLSKSDAERLGIEVSLYSDAKVSTKPQSPRAKSTVSQPQGTNLALGQYVVQVSSQRSEADANASYKALQEKFAILRKYSPIILRADVGANGLFFRAVVGPFTTADAASEFCNSLKSDGGQCVVQRHSQDVVKPAQQYLSDPPVQSSAKTTPVFPTGIAPRYSAEPSGQARMHTCVDQYIANKATGANGGLLWVQQGGGYYAECNRRLRG